MDHGLRDLNVKFRTKISQKETTEEMLVTLSTAVSI